MLIEKSSAVVTMRWGRRFSGLAGIFRMVRTVGRGAQSGNTDHLDTGHYGYRPRHA